MSTTLKRTAQPEKSGLSRQSNGHVTLIALETILPLSSDEKEELKESEEIIQTRLTAFFEVGEALIKIKEGKLYRSLFPTFEEYCRERWDFSRIHAHRLLHAAEIRSSLISTNTSPLPENECQVRPLEGLPPKTAEKAWLKALELADGKKLTGKIVGKAVQIISKGKANKADEREGWQINFQPLLKKATRCCKTGDRDKLIDLIHRMSLLLEIGGRQAIPSEAE